MKHTLFPFGNEIPIPNPVGLPLPPIVTDSFQTVLPIYIEFI